MGSRNVDQYGFRTSPADEEKYKFDQWAHAVTVITENHRMIHDGFFFDMSGLETALANGANLDILITLPAGSFGHLVNVEYTMDDSPCMAYFYEGVTTSADGAAANVRNHNRVNANDSSSAVITTGPTVTDVGTLLHQRYIPTAGGPVGQQHGSLVSGEDNEWVIGSPTVETKYMWRFTNNSGGAINVGYHFNGYEIGYEH